MRRYVDSVCTVCCEYLLMTSAFVHAQVATPYMCTSLSPPPRQNHHHHHHHQDQDQDQDQQTANHHWYRKPPEQTAAAIHVWQSRTSENSQESDLSGRPSVSPTPLDTIANAIGRKLSPEVSEERVFASFLAAKWMGHEGHEATCENGYSTGKSFF